MEKEVKISTTDRKVIVGTLLTAKRKSNALVIFVHGFTGHQNEHIFFNGAKFFAEKGIDTFRFNLYAGEVKGIRRFRDTCISLHGEDVSTVVKHFRKKYKTIYVVGHSYGGTSLLFVEQSLVDGLVFWDAAYISKADSRESLKYNKALDAYILDWGMEIIVGKKFVEGLKHFPDCSKLVQEIHKPILFIATGKGNLGKKYYEHANKPKKFIAMPNADHNFNKIKEEQKLFEYTYNWLK